MRQTVSGVERASLYVSHPRDIGSRPRLTSAARYRWASVKEGLLSVIIGFHLLTYSIFTFFKDHSDVSWRQFVEIRIYKDVRVMNK